MTQGVIFSMMKGAQWSGGRRTELGAEKNQETIWTSPDGAQEAFGWRSFKGMLSTSGGPEGCSEKLEASMPRKDWAATHLGCQNVPC